MKHEPVIRSHWKEVHGLGKVRYLFDYYKLPLLLAGILLYVIIWSAWRSAHAQEVCLYVGLVNFAPSEELIRTLTEDYVQEADYPEGKNIYLYRGLYLSADETSEYHAYSYATRMKILGALDAEKLDVVLMDRESFDSFSQNGYLEDLSLLMTRNSAVAKEGLEAELQDLLVSNIEINEDNSVDVLLGNETDYHAVTTDGMFGLDISEASSIIRDAQLSGDLYLGVIRNSPRQEEALHYIDYLTSEKERNR